MYEINSHKSKWKAGLLLGLFIVLLTGCGSTPQMEYDTAEEAKQALARAQTIEIYVDGEKWFHYDYVTDEPINEDREGVLPGTTYGCYDKDGNCLGYAQEQVTTTFRGRGCYIMFLDTEWNPLPYYSSEDGDKLYNENGKLVGRGDAGSGKLMELVDKGEQKKQKAAKMEAGKTEETMGEE